MKQLTIILDILPLRGNSKPVANISLLQTVMYHAIEHSNNLTKQK